MIIPLVVFHFQRNHISNSSRLDLFNYHYGFMYLKIFVFSEKIRFGSCPFIDEGLEASTYILMFCGFYSETRPLNLLELYSDIEIIK